MLKRSTIVLAFCILISQVSGIAAADESPQAETPQQRDARMAWFREARFGMFIHWGLYAQLAGSYDGKPTRGAGEWIMQDMKIPTSQYEKLVGQFNPVKFDARQWAKIAKDAGMKYMVITSKHHDGFCMFDTKQTDYCIMSTPFKRDPMKELAAACKEQDIKFCFYHSIMDWHHPLYDPRRPWNDTATGDPNMDRYVDYMKGELKELLTNYGPIGILWFDGEWEKTWNNDRGRDLYNYVRGLQPSIIVNNRVAKSRSGMAGMSTGEQPIGDYGTPEQEIPATGMPGVDWETCMTMNNTWGFKRDDQNWKSTRVLLHNLIDIASKGGNYLLNVGPTPEGTIPDESIKRLAEMGQWMKINGESIYGTSASPFRKLKFGRATQKPGKIFVHVFDWPASGKLELPMSSPIAKAYLLVDPTKSLKTRVSETGTTIDLPQAAPDENASVIVLEINGQPKVLFTPNATQGADGTILLRAGDADTTGNARVETIGGDQNIGYWNGARDSVSWDVQVNTPGTFEVELNLACKPESAGSEYVLGAGAQPITAKVPPTKGWDDFQTTKAGKLKIDKPGIVTITIKPRRKPAGEGLMNLRSILLRPSGSE
jgi:alpha-L-fucosidase